MNKLAKALVLAIAIAAPVAISAPAVHAQDNAPTHATSAKHDVVAKKKTTTTKPKRGSRKKVTKQVAPAAGAAHN